MSDPTKGWLPIVLCPTDGVDRALLLPDGSEVVGAHHNLGGWQTTTFMDYDQTVYEEKLRGGLLPMPWEPPKRGERREPRAIGSRKVTMRLIGKLPEGVYPTHFRPNDTVYGVPSSKLAGWTK